MHYVAIDKNTLVEDTEVGCDRNGALIERNIEKLYILSKDYKDFFKYQEKNLPKILSNNNLSFKERSQAVYHVAKSLTKDILQDIGTAEVDLGRAA